MNRPIRTRKEHFNKSSPSSRPISSPAPEKRERKSARRESAAAMALPASSSTLSRFLSSRRIQPTDVTALATWGIFAGSAAIYLVQPFDWIKKTFFEKPEPEA
uniref:Ubiquinol-cytochrome c reductase complex 6.7 kDa protein n=1 Tax=Aegilops tauschii subsp. strangulata TaxID=200361 RepID=A0A453AP05_AEGTS